MTGSVLIVEDDPVVRGAFSAAIAAAPDLALVGAASDCATAMAMLDLAPDVLLVDLRLPDGNGIDVIREAARRLPDCEIMVVTLFGDEASVMDSIAAGATGYLLKDDSGAQIVEHVRVLRAGGSPVSPVIARQLLNRLPVTPQVNGSGGDVALSEQESRVLGYAARGFTYQETAEQMGVSRHSVQTYVKRAYRKLQVHSKVEALTAARRLRLLQE